MTMDNPNPVAENIKRKKWDYDHESNTTTKKNSRLQKNGSAYSNSDRSNCGEKENMFKNKITECPDDRITCGLGPCAPNWLQSFASKQVFLMTFCLTWVLQGMFNSYFVSVITTIEKVFQFQSKMTGLLLAAIEIGQISCTLLFTYYGGHGHRPRWIACGMVLFAICSFSCSLPYFFFSHGTTYLDIGDNTSMISSNLGIELCHNISADLKDGGVCDEQILSEQQSQTRNIVVIIFLISLLGIGMGQTPVYTLGISYIDDNVAGRESPLYFTITIGVRILGPALGFLLGSFCTRLNLNFMNGPTSISPTDPRWIGAWWLGLVLDSALLAIVSFAMFSFPKKLKSSRPTPAIRPKQDTGRKKPKLKDFPKTLKRLLKNDILMLKTASSVLHIIPIAGLYTFLPKFLESQFRFPAHSANMATGVGGILVMGFGILMSGAFILKIKPNAKFVAGWIACSAGLYAMGMGLLMFVGCPMNDLADMNYDSKGTIYFNSECIDSCKCDKKFTPICGSDNFTHYSACYAGCQSIGKTFDGKERFDNCTCLKPFNRIDNSTITDFTATMGYCESDCNNFVWYILIFSIFVFIHSTSEVGSMLLTLRCVDPRDKAMALGVIQFAIGLFGNVPCSFLYGVVVDAACLVWDMVCGKEGACSFYHRSDFRHYFHGMTGAIMFCAFIVDLVVWFKADKIDFEDTLPQTQEEELTPITEKSCFENSKN